MSTTPPLVAVYADESCKGNGRTGDNPGGAAALVEYRGSRGGGTLIRRDLWVSEPATTNNRMALRSAIEVLRALSKKGRRLRVVFTTDSQYLVKGMSEWVHLWAARGWKRKGGVLENEALWLEAIQAAMPHECQWRWVRGHDGHPQNEYANALAMRAADHQTSSDGLVPSGFDEWLTAWRAAGRAVVAPDPFPDPTAFRAGRPLPAPPAGRLL